MLVLASQSPRRRELLAQAGYVFEVDASAVPEEPRTGEDPSAFVRRLAGEKAQAVHARRGGQQELIVLGADTAVVTPQGAVLGKPVDGSDAASMLRQLSGATHQVVTGVCLLSGDHVESAVEITYVTMLTLADEEIAEYIASGEPMDKAGAYAIQGRAAKWIPRIHGCYFNVVGLPLALVTSMIEGVTRRMQLEVRA
ncbi:Maf family protein [Acidipila rosea]|uniref:dTTP/UTP pyrophosphatase n=1 Tax=Acidipila rosea TaxID=768535 RepID=A0A4R1L1W7_9BACT|nr:Maf family protein [Acidipila rosea]MBW4028127.1 septum formation inhibitor Maf [Acidobacteriota bacterium]MBW4046116.1 septum formation inhibitor Maf [Acidobacteriota bacterium]TCK71966.1 septum formation protein [Acidipila rosea]